MKLGHHPARFLAPRPTFQGRTPSRLWRNVSAISRHKKPANGIGQVKVEGPALRFLSTLELGLQSSNRDKEDVQELVARTAEQAVKNGVIEEFELQQKAVLPPPDLRNYLEPVGVMELKHIRMLSNLCSRTYFMNKLTPRSLYRRHRLKLLTTSRACEASLRETCPSAQEIISEADAMAADPALVRLWYKRPQPAAGTAAATAVQGGNFVKVVACSPKRITATAAEAVPPLVSGGPISPVGAGRKAISSLSLAAGTAAASPGDMVAGSLVTAATAAAAAATSVYSAAAASAASAASVAAPLANNIQSFTSSVTSTLSPMRSLAAQLQSAAAAGRSTAVATMAAVSAALDSALGKDKRLPKECLSPTEWFVCDDEVSHTRYFVIQGSDNLDHWRVNLTFDPVVFEDEALGVKVHRGVYEAAAVLYEWFLPLVQDHLDSSPRARLAFTGHSLGGSLATLLMLMLVRRGVVPCHCLAPTYTFGAPTILSEGVDDGDSCSPSSATRSGQRRADGSKGRGEGGSKTAAAAGGLLPLLGLPQDAVRNVVMHKDIVPRAFACDYSPVADLLKRVASSFRDHAPLQGKQKVMFNFIGQVAVLQPDVQHTFVAGEGYHPMLPPEAGLFRLRQPSVLHAAKAVARWDAAMIARALRECANAVAAGAPGGGASSLESSTTTARQAAQDGADPTCVIGSRARPGYGPPPRTVKRAVFELMNNPHPLDILADSAAYGPAGRVSRYHNPDNYTRALGGVLRSSGATLKRLVRHASGAGSRRDTVRKEQAQAAHQLAGAGRGGKAAAAVS